MAYAEFFEIQAPVKIDALRLIVADSLPHNSFSCENSTWMIQVADGRNRLS